MRVECVGEKVKGCRDDKHMNPASKRVRSSYVVWAVSEKVDKQSPRVSCVLCRVSFIVGERKQK